MKFSVNIQSIQDALFLAKFSSTLNFWIPKSPKSNTPKSPKLLVQVGPVSVINGVITNGNTCSIRVHFPLTTIDGSEILQQLGLVVSAVIFYGFKKNRWLFGISEPSTVC